MKIINKKGRIKRLENQNINRKESITLRYLEHFNVKELPICL